MDSVASEHRLERLAEIVIAGQHQPWAGELRIQPRTQAAVNRQGRVVRQVAGHQQSVRHRLGERLIEHAGQGSLGVDAEQGRTGRLAQMQVGDLQHPPCPGPAHPAETGSVSATP
jgi:hypothetical protein